MTYIEQLDVQILELIKLNLQNPIMNKILYIVTTLGNKGFIWLIISMVMIIKKEQRKIGFMAIAALVLAAILGEGVLKPLIERPRPFVDYTEFKTLLVNTVGYSFPSGHTASSFAVAGILMKKLEKRKWLNLALASGIAFSRLYFFVHYPSDIIAGILLGLICSGIVIKLANLIKSSRLTG